MFLEDEVHILDVQRSLSNHPNFKFPLFELPPPQNKSNFWSKVNKGITFLTRQRTLATNV